MSQELAIRLRGAVKRYGEITAVAGLDLDVPVGTCVGLLGPNGAGKSTTMRMLTAQAIADEGELEVLGHRLPQDSKQARAECGVVPQLDNLDVSLTVEQNLLVFTHLYRIPRHERQAAIERSLELANLTDRRETRVDKLSGGMRRRLLIARALVHQPRLVLLDEPTVGLDPQVRQELWALIDSLRSQGVSLLMSTTTSRRRSAWRTRSPSWPRGGRSPPARRSSWCESTRARRCSRCTARRRGWPRWRRRRCSAACALGGPARALPCWTSLPTAISRRRACGGPRTSRTSSCC